MLTGDLRTTIETLLKRGSSLRQIARSTGVDRKTIRSHIRSKVSRGSNPLVTEEVAAETTPVCRPQPRRALPDCALGEPAFEFQTLCQTTTRPSLSVADRAILLA